MLNLDDLAIYERLDPSGMMAQLNGLPEQCQAAWKQAKGFKLPEEYADIDKLVILGMGGSAIGGDFIRSLALSAPVPIIFVNRDYDLPSFIDTRTLVIASSYSGNTEETISAFSQALEKKCKKLVISTGGKLQALAEEAKVPIFKIKHVSQPRAALGYGLIPLLVIVQNLGFLTNEMADIPQMIEDLKRSDQRWSKNIPTKSNPAKQIAVNLYNKIVVIYGAGVLSNVARRWKTQINENSKTWAFYEVFPELNHNAVAGYGLPGELASNIYVILLRCSSIHHRTLLRYDITSEILKQNNISHQIVDSTGKDQLSQMMNMVFLGDWVSFYLAILYQIDPTPVSSIEYLKKRLSEVR